MVQSLKRFLNRILNDTNYRILGLEIVLFSGLFGITAHSWLVFGLMSLSLFWLLNRSKGIVYSIFVLSFIWGFLVFAIIFNGGEWKWATAMAGIMFLFGLRLHFRDLKRPLSHISMAVDTNVADWRRNGYFGQQNLN